MAEKTTVRKKKVATKKKTATQNAQSNLSQQVKQQAELIDQLSSELEQKKAALAALTEKSEDYAAKFDEVQKEKQQTTRQDTKYQAEIADLKQLIEADEKKLSDATAQNKVKTHIIASMGLSLIPAPLFDIAALTAVQLNMLRNLCGHYSINFNEHKSKAIINALISGSLPVVSIVGLSAIKIIPGIGTIGGGIGMATTSGIIAYATGEVFIKHFSNNGTLEDFDSSRWRSYFKEKLDEGKKLIQSKMPVKAESKPGPLAKAS